MHRIVRLLCVLSLAWAASCAGQVAEPEPPKLLGRVTTEQLGQEPFSEWFQSGYEEYTPNAEVLEALRGVETDDLQVEIFFGTWCGDSRREVPRWAKLFDAMGLSEEQFELIAVDNTDEANKRSPGGEEKGLEIYRVPTTIVRRGGVETGRVVEHPVLSIERDLLSILDDAGYEPNYPAYPVIRRWLDEGLLADPNVSPRGLAGEIRHVISGEGDLAGAGRVLLSRGDTAEAVKLFRVNCALHRESASAYARLAGALLETGDTEKAREAAERALRLNDDPERTEELTRLLERTE